MYRLSARMSVLIRMQSAEIHSDADPGSNPFRGFELPVQSPLLQFPVRVVVGFFRSVAGLCGKSPEMTEQGTFLPSERKDRKNPICEWLAGFFMAGGFILVLIVAGMLLPGPIIRWRCPEEQAKICFFRPHSTMLLFLEQSHLD